MEKLTIEKFQTMTKKEIETFFNACVSNLKCVSIDRSYVRDEMIDTIKERVDDSFKVRSTLTTGAEMSVSIPSKAIHLNFKVGTKATGKTKQVTKLRKKNVVGIGKFKLDRASRSYEDPCYLIDLSTYKLSIDPKWSHGGKSLWYENIEAFSDMFDPVIIREKLERKYNQEYDKTYGLKHHIVLSGGQDLLTGISWGNVIKRGKILGKHALSVNLLDAQACWDKGLELIENNNEEFIEEMIQKMCSGE